MQLQENMVVADRFRLVRMIGRGGMGSVWQAMHLGLDTPCAVKFIEGELANVAEAHARFEREAKAAAQLRSPHVVQIFDHGVWQGRPYIAMELLDGEDLGKRIAKEHGRLSPGTVNTVIQQVCRALSKAHQSGVVHRDLKPDNIFLVTDDDREIVKILDFGVAKQTSNTIDGSNTKTGAMLGTPYYMSPEQAQGIKSVDARSDLWSLAVIVFQCITGRLPFESEALGDLLVKIIVNPIPMPSSVYAMCPPGFDNWWVKASDRNPDNRFQTAKAFAEALGMALGQSSVTDITDRSKLKALGGATAMMAQAPNMTTPQHEVRSAVPNTPMPGAQTAAMITPNPMMQTPGPAHMPPPAHAAQTGATFSGVEPPVTVPKSGPPVGLLIGLGAVALIGLALGGVALMRGRAAPPPSEPVAASAPPEASSAPVASAAPSDSSATAANDPPPSPSATEAPPETPEKPAEKPPEKPVVAAGHRPAQPAAPSKPLAAPAKPPEKPVAATSPPATPAKPAASTGPKPINLGF
ncbi:MAG: protein kinase [Labilithrix sp.]|nr:protein kinase [Labilithrix sp.]